MAVRKYLFVCFSSQANHEDTLIIQLHLLAIPIDEQDTNDINNFHWS